MTLAAATSTPTSITVVATRSASGPSAKAFMTASLSLPFMRPCTSPTRAPKRCVSSAARASAAARSLSSDSSTSGQTQ
jgi:hypothetical protein